jgi:tripartite-type tricarboxylate transporter receptor subunit TctC
MLGVVHDIGTPEIFASCSGRCCAGGRRTFGRRGALSGSADSAGSAVSARRRVRHYRPALGRQGEIFLGGSTIHLTEMILREHPLLDPMKELTPVSIVAVNYYAIVVNPAVPVHSLQELVPYVRANPGKLAYGSAGTGTVNHLTGELFKSLTGLTDLPHVAYRGAGPAIADAIGGQIPIIVPAMTNQVLEFHRTGKLRLLAITSPNRIPVAPEISTAVEGGVPDLVTQQVMALFAPAGTPKPIIAQIDEANHRAMADATYRQSLVDAAVIPVPDWTTTQFDEFMRTEITRWTPLVKAIGVRLD